MWRLTLWGHMVMLHQNMLQQVMISNVVSKIYVRMYVFVDVDEITDLVIQLIYMSHLCTCKLTGYLYVKSDVYGFGVVLLEILTGLRALDPKRPSEQHNLVDWTKPLLSSKKKLKTIMDARMEGQYSFKAALKTAHITLKCLAPDPKSRPSMKEVVEELEQIQAIKKKLTSTSS